MKKACWSAVALALALCFAAEVAAQDAPGGRAAARLRRDIANRQRALERAERGLDALTGEARETADKTVVALNEYLAKAQALLAALEADNAEEARELTAALVPLRTAVDAGIRDMGTHAQITRHREMAERMKDNPRAAAASNKVVALYQRQLRLQRDIDSALAELTEAAAAPERPAPAERPRRPRRPRRPADDDEDGGEED